MFCIKIIPSVIQGIYVLITRVNIVGSSLVTVSAVIFKKYLGFIVSLEGIHMAQQIH